MPDRLKLIPFFDWGLCRGARHELVGAIMSPSWPPRDLALTACRVNEVGKIMRRAGKQHGGGEYVGRIAQDLAILPQAWR